MPRALLSVSDKTGIVDLARGLANRGFALVSTGGTARTLGDAGLAVTEVSALTGVPEMLDGRVKTLHPAVHGGILARRDRPDDLDAIGRHGIGLIDVVVVNLYPFAKAAANEDVPFAGLVEEIDIGGPSLLRAAAKNFQDVLVVVDPLDYPRVLAALDEGPSLALRHQLMVKAFAHTSEYDTTIARTLRAARIEGGRVVRGAVESSNLEPAIDFDKRIELSMEQIRVLRYGENPHQHAAWYRLSDGPAAGPLPRGFGGATSVQGKELSYTNLLDLDAAARIVLEFQEPAAAVIKHSNPCGVATGRSAADACNRAREADRGAAYGGIIGLNRAIDRSTAQAIVSTFIEAVIAPSVDEDARSILATKPNMRVVTAEVDDLVDRLEWRSILGALLAQERDRVVEARAPWRPDRLPSGLTVVTQRPPTPDEWTALRFAWRVAAHVKSNAVLFANAEQTLAIGAGQMSRVDAVRVAVMKAASGTLVGSVAASDAFFPFRDGVDAIAGAGATAVVHPGGSVRDGEVIAAADEHGMAMVVTGRRHFRH